MSSSPEWILTLLGWARERRWCTKVGCTTCGALEFRRALSTLLCRSAGILPSGRSQSKSLRTVGLSGLSPTDFETVVKVAVDDLVLADDAEVMACAGDRCLSDLHMILYELRLTPWTVNLDSALVARLKGSKLWASVIAAEEAQLEWDRRREREYILRVERERAGKEEARLRRAVAAKERGERYAERSAKLADALSRFRMLPVQERLAALADDRFELPLEAVPVEVVPIEPEALSTLTEATRTALIDRIGRRGGPWGRLRDYLRNIETRTSLHSRHQLISAITGQ